MIKTAPTPKAKRDLHPRAQLAYHQRCSARAQAKIEWLHELHARHGASYAPDRAELDRLHAKVLSHLRACVELNDAYDLGFVVTVSMRQMVGL